MIKINKIFDILKIICTKIKDMCTYILHLFGIIVHLLYVVLVSKPLMFVYGVILTAYLILPPPQTYPDIPKAEAPDYVQEIYYNLRKVTGMQGKVPPIYMINTQWSFYTVNAYASIDGIYITYGMLMTVKNNDELALVISHEIAHELAGHVTEHRDLAQQQMEDQADQLGAFLMMRAGYDICTGKEFWTRINNIYGDEAVSSHPSNSFRAWQLDMPQCHK